MGGRRSGSISSVGIYCDGVATLDYLDELGSMIRLGLCGGRSEGEGSSGVETAKAVGR